MGTATDIQLRPTAAYNSNWFVTDYANIDEPMHYRTTANDDGEKAIASGGNGDALEWQWWNTGNIPSLTGGQLSDVTLYALFDDVSNMEPTDCNVAIGGTDETSLPFDSSDFHSLAHYWGGKSWRRSDSLDSGISNMRLGLKSDNLQPPNNTTYIGCAYIDVIQTVNCFILRPTSSIANWAVGTYADINDAVISGGQAISNRKYCQPQEKSNSLDFMEMGVDDIPAVSGAALSTIRLYCDGGANEKCKIRVNNVWSAEVAWDGTENGFRYKDFTYTDDISSGIPNMGLAVQAETLGNGENGSAVSAAYLQVNFTTSEEVEVKPLTIQFNLKKITSAITVEVKPLTIEFNLKKITGYRSYGVKPLTIEFNLKKVSSAIAVGVKPLGIEFNLKKIAAAIAVEVKPLSIEFNIKKVTPVITVEVKPLTIQFNLMSVIGSEANVVLRTPVITTAVDIRFNSIQTFELNITRVEP